MEKILPHLDESLFNKQVSVKFSDAGISPDSVLISYHLTSIYDHSVFEAYGTKIDTSITYLGKSIEFFSFNLFNGKGIFI